MDDKIPNNGAIFSHLSINLPGPNTEIWIADDVCINCRTSFNWFNRLMLRLILDWKVKKK